MRAAGVLVFSIEHPTVVYRRAGRRYFDTEQVAHRSEWLGVLQTYRRPLEAYFEALRTLGFLVEDVREAFPTAACKEQYPEAYAKLCEFPYFLSVRARCASGTSLQEMYNGESVALERTELCAYWKNKEKWTRDRLTTTTLTMTRFTFLRPLLN